MEKRYLAHVPTEQFGFISVELSGTPEQAVEAYREVAMLVKDGLYNSQGVSEAEFRTLYDKVAKGEAVQGDPGIIEQLSPMQRFALNEVKKFNKRNIK